MHTQPIDKLAATDAQGIRGVLTDLDDTLTWQGKLGANAYQALWQLKNKGLTVVVVTGRPAGWVDHIARMWPVDGVIGENGACYYYMDLKRGKLERRMHSEVLSLKQTRQKLERLAQKILREVPGSALASDQFCRIADVAIDYCEDVKPLSAAAVQQIVDLFHQAGATCKVSSIHVNGWFGNYNKLDMTRQFFDDVLGVDLDVCKSNYLFVGDSPNDEPLFEYFPNSVGVANVQKYLSTMAFPPRWITLAKGGDGFTELSYHLLNLQK